MVVIVTGGSRGLGRAMSLGFAREGAKVLVARRKPASCEEVVALITPAYSGIYAATKAGLKVLTAVRTSVRSTCVE